MAFKTRDPNKTPEELERESQHATEVMFDRHAFGSDVAKGERPLDVATFQMLKTPLSDLSSVSFLAKDNEGYVEMTLRGDRNPTDLVFGDDWSALAKKLEAQGADPRTRAGVTIEATGRFGRMVGSQWQPGAEGFRGGRGFAIATATVDLGDGKRMDLGRPLASATQVEAPVVGGQAVSNDARPAIADPTVQASDDARVFKGKPIRSVELRLEHGAFSPDAQGDWTIGAANDRGPVGLRLPADRAAAWKEQQGPAFQAFGEAQAAMKADPDARGLRIQAQGAFVKHTLDSAGVAKEQWEFVATSFRFHHAGKTHEVGRPVVALEGEKTPPSNAKHKQRGQER